jgi:signal transduction histidine kinase
LEQQAAAIQQQNTQLSTKNIEFEQLNTLKNEFLGIAAHDLRNPLTHIMLSADALISLSDISKERRSVYAMRILTSAELMLRIIRNLLDVNKIESDGFSLLAEFLPADIVRDIAESHRPNAEYKHITLIIESNTDTQNHQPSIYADRSALTQVLDNLLSNALKYSPPEKRVWVRIRSVENASTFAPMTMIEVEDEGPGFSESDKTRLFQKFARLSAKPTGGENSTGLGLAIVKQFVEAMRGTVECTSELGNGAIFTVVLPAQAP